MKQFVIPILLTFLLSISAFAQTEFKVSFNLGYPSGHKPTFTPIESTETVTLDRARQLFKEIKSNSGIEFRYSYGGCEDRAHAISLLLSEKEIKHRKIWNFDPYYVSLFNAQQQPNIKDRTELTNKVGWGFHVAVILSVKELNETNLMVFDPAVADELLTVRKWLEFQNAPNSYYTFTDSQWFSFYTIDGRSFNGKPMPDNFPKLLTGDFIRNEGQNLTDMWVEEGLAVNQTGMQIISEIISKEPVSSKKREVFIKLVTNIDLLTCFLKGTCVSDASTNYENDARKYQSEFTEIRNAWKARLDKIRRLAV